MIAGAPSGGPMDASTDAPTRPSTDPSTDAPTDAPTDASFRHDGFRFAAELTGKGRRLMFCHGSGGSRASSRFILEALAEHASVAAHDQRGLGETGLRRDAPDPFLDAQTWTMADYAADALAFADSLGWSTFALLGISFGGMVAQEVAVTAPDRLECLVLMCTSAGGAGRASFPLHVPRNLAAEQERQLVLQLIDSRFDDEWLADRPFETAMVRFRDAQAARPRTEEQMVGEHGQLLARAGHDVWDRLPRVSCPTLVASGRFDLIAPSANSAAIASQVQDGRFAEFDGGHAFFVQDKAAWPAVYEFLAES